MFTRVKKTGGTGSFLSNAMATRSDGARSLDAEIGRQTSMKALKRNESCQNEDIKKKKKKSVPVILFVKSVLMGVFFFFLVCFSPSSLFRLRRSCDLTVTAVSYSCRREHDVWKCSA